MLVGFAGFAAALVIQFRMHRYVPWAYWLAVGMVGVFGTMVADVLHVGFDVPFWMSAGLFAVSLTAIFLVWSRVEGNLSIHSIDSTRREAFYWLAVVATFALGTAVGDLTAVTVHRGYFLSAMLFAVGIAIPAIGFTRFRWNAIFSFWCAYVVTRPLGASLADWLGKPTSEGGFGVGSGLVALTLTLVIAGLVAYLSAAQRVDTRVVAGEIYVGPVGPQRNIRREAGLSRIERSAGRANLLNANRRKTVEETAPY
ncbi:hypothetical protein [Cryobacterium algoritolerans]|uniref:COG4705 family protein n=1 Tax=Cryobacterium algoritolerans TaxID=1259184 RepID=UPI0018E0B3F2|nr:hypothetical protein [Cryobacterium algoritolerans]